MAQNVAEPEDIVAIKCIDKKALKGKEDSLDNEIKVLRRLVLGWLARRWRLLRVCVSKCWPTH